MRILNDIRPGIEAFLMVFSNQNEYQYTRATSYVYAVDIQVLKNITCLPRFYFWIIVYH